MGHGIVAIDPRFVFAFVLQVDVAFPTGSSAARHPKFPRKRGLGATLTSG
jgi:hypothetical protein